MTELEQTSQPPATRLDQLLAEIAKRYPQRTALVKQSSRITYEELDSTVNRMANLLVSRGLRPGERVAISALNGIEFVVAYYATVRAGGAVVPLNVLMGDQLLAHRLEDSGAAFLFCAAGPDGVPSAQAAHNAANKIRTCREAIVVDARDDGLEHLIQGQPCTFDAVSTDPEEAAVIAFIQRQSGRPDAAVHTHAAMVHNARAITDTLYANAPYNQVHLVALPLFHPVTQSLQLNAGIAHGAKLVLKPRYEPAAALKLMANEQVTAFVAAPSMLWALACAAGEHPEDARAAKASLRMISSQMAPLPEAASEAIKDQLDIRPLEGFGLSETGMVALHARPGDDRHGSVGDAVAGFDVRLVDSSGQPLTDAGTGEIQVRGAGMMREYFRNPEATAAVMQDGWFQTGHFAERAADGHYEMVDRPTHVVMRRGLAIYRREVEEALLTHPAITGTSVVSEPHQHSSEEPQTVIERDPKSVVSEAELLQWAKEQLPGLAGTDIQLDAAPAEAGWTEKLKVVSKQLLPGFAFTAVGTALAFVVNMFVPLLSPLTAGVLLGVVATNTGLITPRIGPGVSFAMKRLLRIGVVFLGLQLSLLQVVGLGFDVLAIIIVIVSFGFLFTRWVGKRLGLSDDLSLLTATGFSICGASAIAGMQSTSGANEDDVAIAIALVTIFGTLAMFIWPLLQPVLHLSNEAFGIWAGASVHEVAQVVAAASPAGSESLSMAVVVKLARVIMLAPLIAIVAYSVRRRSQHEVASSDKKPPLVPLFVLGFLSMVGVRTTGVLPENVLNGFEVITTVLLAAALFGLGTAVRVRVLWTTGPRALALGTISTLGIAAVAYLGVLLAVYMG